MSGITDVFESSRLRPLGLQKRPDLTVAKHVYRNEPFWMIKDPLEMEFYRLNEEEYAILDLVDGRRSLDQIREAFEAKFPPQRITHRQLQSFVSELHTKSLLAYTDNSVGQQLITRSKEKRWEKFKKNISGVLTLKWRGIDPDRLLDFLTPKVGWLFSAPTVCAALVFMASALTWLLVHLQTFLARLPALSEFLEQRNWLLLGCVIIVMKILHELAHGISFKRFGGECHEIGIMLLILIPTLYCSTTDSWLLKNKWHRAAIAAAGMYIELLVAAIATYCWWFSQPGTLNLICLNIMATGSLSVIVFNANPFLKYDGYYICSDLLELPNLRERAGKQTQNWFLRYGLGIDEECEPHSRLGTKVALVIYKLSSFMFKVFIIVLIKFLLIDRLAPFGLKYFGLTLGVLALVTLFAPPLWGLYKFFKVPGRMRRIEMKNSLLTITMAILLGVGLFVVPLPHYVKCPFTLEPRGAQPLYVQHDAVLRAVHVTPGERVQPGALIAELENIDKMLTLTSLQSQGEEHRTELLLLESSRQASPKLAARISELRELVETNRRSVAEYETIASSFRIVAPRAGEVIPEWLAQRPESEEELASWDGSPLAKENLGTWLASGQKLCSIGDLDQFDAVLAVNEHDISLVATGQPVRLMLDSASHQRFSSTVSSLARKEAEQLPGSLSKQNGGTIQLQPKTKNSRAEAAAHPNDEHFEARVVLDDFPRSLSSGLRGHARVHVGQRTIFQRMMMAIQRTFRKKL